VYVVVQSLLAGKGLLATDAFNAYILMFLTTIYLWAVRQSPKRRTQLMMLIVAALIFNFVYSIWVLIQDPDASRTAAAIGVLDPSPYDVLHAVGSFDAVYGGVNLVTVLLLLLRGLPKEDKRRWLFLAVLVLCVVFIYMAAYATALLMLIVTVALVFGSKNKVLSISVILAFLLILVLHKAVGGWIMEQSTVFSGSETIREKLYEFGEMLKTFETAGTYGGADGRAARMQWSLDSFRAHPLFGGYAVKGSKIGGHSELLDMLGKFGAIGLVFFAAFLVSLYKQLRESSNTPAMKSCCTIVFFVWIITAILNPALYSLQMMPIILFLPLSAMYLNDIKTKFGKED